ncbi:MAG TPA: ATP phosphoribosyltransferase regulatory subunit [Thermoanaerobaculia bacterium]|nr:ATP phosphoribosyltransferase regulatory subunit [Thermoanaerobaculia bacterium]
MAGKKLRYPTGVRPLLVAESARRRAVEARVTAILERAGFDEVILPIIDYADAYAVAGAVDSRQTYRFVDRDGDLVALRSDFTPMLARALAPTLTPAELPLRVFYRGDVIRYEASRLGTDREMFQIGAEIIGDASPQADIESLSLVSEILRDLGTKPTIVFTDSTIPERVAPDAREWLATKRAPSNAPEIVKRLIAGTAKTSDLPPDIGERLEAIAQACTDCVIHLDDVDRTRGYYTGLRFRAYDAASRVVIAQGGRYDNLYEKFGSAAPAVGFTITCE